MPEFENRHSFDAGKFSAEKERRERNKREKDDELIREVFEYFDVQKKGVQEGITRTRVLALRKRFETTKSLDELRKLLETTLHTKEITDEDIAKIRSIFEKVYESSRNELDKLKQFINPLIVSPSLRINPAAYPLHGWQFVKMLEDLPMGQKPFLDIIAVTIGLLESSYVLGRESFLILLDLLKLPYDAWKDWTLYMDSRKDK